MRTNSCQADSSCRSQRRTTRLARVEGMSAIQRPQLVLLMIRGKSIADCAVCSYETHLFSKTSRKDAQPAQGPPVFLCVFATLREQILDFYASSHYNSLGRLSRTFEKPT